MSSRTDLTVHTNIREAVATAATWTRVTGRRYAVHATHIYGYTAAWAVVAAER